MDFMATHRLTLVRDDGTIEALELAVDPETGAALTREESVHVRSWDQEPDTAWCRWHDGLFRFCGRLVPEGYQSVRAEVLGLVHVVDDKDASAFRQIIATNGDITLVVDVEEPLYPIALDADLTIRYVNEDKTP